MHILNIYRNIMAILTLESKSLKENQIPRRSVFQDLSCSTWLWIFPGRSEVTSSSRCFRINLSVFLLALSSFYLFFCYSLFVLLPSTRTRDGNHNRQESCASWTLETMEHTLRSGIKDRVENMSPLNALGTDTRGCSQIRVIILKKK